MSREAQFLVDYHDYYRTPRCFHPRAVNSNGSWTLTTPLSFMNMPLLTYIKEISPRPVLFVYGEKSTRATSAKPPDGREASGSRLFRKSLIGT